MVVCTTEKRLFELVFVFALLCFAMFCCTFGTAALDFRFYLTLFAFSPSELTKLIFSQISFGWLSACLSFGCLWLRVKFPNWKNSHNWHFHDLWLMFNSGTKNEIIRFERSDMQPKSILYTCIYLFIAFLLTTSAAGRFLNRYRTTASSIFQLTFI